MAIEKIEQKLNTVEISPSRVEGGLPPIEQTSVVPEVSQVAPVVTAQQPEVIPQGKVGYDSPEVKAAVTGGDPHNAGTWFEILENKEQGAELQN